MSVKSKPAEIEATSFYDLEPIIGDLHRWAELLTFKCCDETHGVSGQIADQIWNEAEKLKATFHAAHKAKAKKKTRVEDGIDNAIEGLQACHLKLAIWRMENEGADLPEDLVEELTREEGKVCSTPVRSLASLKKKVEEAIEAGTPTQGEWLTAIYDDLKAMEC